MDHLTFVAVLGAAILHATWNSVIRVGSDRAASILLLSIAHALIALPVLVFATPPAPASWPWLVTSAGLHVGYQLFLVQAYDHGDLSRTYPLARGGAPLIVTVVTVAGMGVALSTQHLVATLLISAGLLGIALAGGGMRGRGLFWALGTACFTAGYTLADGFGARASGSATGFLMWMFVLNAVAMGVIAGALRGRAAFAGLRPHLATGLGAGAMSMLSYWIAVWAFTRAPIALVAALRETSILFALLIAALWLREPVDRWRWLAAGLIVAGIAAMRMGGG